jgi:hypothetical protein
VSIYALKIPVAGIGGKLGGSGGLKPSRLAAPKPPRAKKSQKTDPPLTRSGSGGYGRFRKSLSELVELMGIEPMTS